MDAKLTTQINFMLIVLILIDLVLATVALFFPELWFAALHGVAYDDPQGLQQRSGALWAAFTLFQLIALLRWRRELWWLPLVAGMRFSEIFTDFVLLYVAADLTLFGRLGFFISPLFTAFAGWFLLSRYRKIVAEAR